MVDVTRILDGTHNTLTLTGLDTTLADGEYWASNGTDIEASTVMDVLVGGKILVNSSGVDGTIQIYAAGSLDGGTTYSGNCSGTVGETSTIYIPQCFTLGVITADANSVTYEFGPYSLRQAFGELPDRFVIVVVNETGQNLGAVSSHEIHYKKVYYQL